MPDPTPEPIEPEVVTTEPQPLVPTQGAEPPAVIQPAGTPAHFLEMALAKGADVTELGPLMDLYERWEKGEARKAFYDAMANFKAIMPPIAKGKQVDYASKKGGRVKYKHATLDAIAEAIRSPMERCGLSYRFETESIDHGLTVTCIVTHRDGHSEQTKMSAPADDSGGKNYIQQLGSTMTYMRRYTLEGVLGLSTTDDTDGQYPPDDGSDPMADFDNAVLPPATEQTDESQSVRGPNGLWIREILDVRDAGKEGTRRELLIRDWPDHWRLITYSNFEKYKGDGKNEWKNPGVNRPCTTNIPKGRNVGKQVHFLGEHLRHPAATGALDVPGFKWEDAPRVIKPEDGDASATPSKADFFRTRIGAQMRRLTAEQREQVPPTYQSEPDEGVLKALLDQVLTWVGENAGN